MIKSPLIRNILAVGAGSAGGQIVAVAFSPFVTRIFGPEVFGLQGLFLSWISILGPIIALRYPMAIVLADTDNDSSNLAALSMRIAVCLSLLCGVIVLIAQRVWPGSLGLGELGGLIWLLPLALFATAISDISNFRAARISAFRLVGVVSFIVAFVTNAMRVLGGLLAPVPAVLVGVTTLAPLVYAAMITFGMEDKGGNKLSIKRIQALELLKKHRDFPLFRMPNDVLNAASQAIPVILLASLYSPTAAGLYTLTRTVLNLPTNIISKAIGNVLYTRFAELARDRQPVTPLLFRSTGLLAVLAPVIIGLTWFAPNVFAIVFGEEWREAGFYARWMSLWIALMIANQPTVRILAVIGHQKLGLWFNCFLILVRVLSVLIVFWFSGSALTAVASYSICSAVAIAIGIVMFAILSGRYDQNNLRAYD